MTTTERHMPAMPPRPGAGPSRIPCLAAVSDPAAAGRRPPLRMRRLTPRHAVAIMALRARVLAALARPDLYAAEADEAGFIARHCGPAGITLGIFDGETLVAYGMLYLPDADADATGHAGMTASHPSHPSHASRRNATERAAIAELSSCMVDPDWRGRGLQRRLIEARLRWGVRHGARRFRVVVAPHNAASRRNLRMAGFRRVWAGDVDGHHRLVLGWEV
ncbi:MAG: GNAT family N-acetyltransferase [Janthinobacterium lividum]